MWESFRDYALRELREVKHAPAAVGVLLVLGVATGWWAASQFYAERIEVLQLHIAALERGVAVVRQVSVPSAWTPMRMAVFALVLVVGVVAAVTAISNKRKVKGLDRSVSALRGLLDDGVKENQRVTIERDEAVVALKNKKHEYAMETLERYANARFIDDIKPRVTIRYCSYGQDHEIAMQLKGLFTQYVRWDAELELATKPALPRAEKFKVLFDVGRTFQTYGPLIRAISEGDFLGVTVGRYEFVDRDDSEHLIVNVLPSVDSELPVV
jgi:hypothetical protein